MNDTAKLPLLDALYATLPKIKCQQKCSESCGPIVITRLEAKRLGVATSGMLTCLESGQRLGVGRLVDTDACLNCPLLKDGKCSKYEIRPGICRLWGLTKKMACPFGCEPERWVTDQEGFEFTKKVFALGF